MSIVRSWNLNTAAKTSDMFGMSVCAAIFAGQNDSPKTVFTADINAKQPCQERFPSSFSDTVP